MNNKTTLAVLIVALVALVGYIFFTTYAEPSEIVINQNYSGSEELKRFTSSAEIASYLKEHQSNYNAYGRGEVLTAESDAAGSVAAPAVSGQKSATDYSTTNVQVAGVDEADFVKNDGEYLYVLSGNKLVIVDAYPGESAEIISTTLLTGTPRDLYVNGDRLVVFSDSYEPRTVIPRYGFAPQPYYTQQTSALIYDISEREQPKLVKNYSLSGYYYQSRMKEDTVYVISQESVHAYGDLVVMPTIKESSKIIAQPEVYYFDMPAENYVFYTISSFDLEDEQVESKSFMMGYAGTLYVSENAIYLAYAKQVPYTYYESEQRARFYDVVVPLLPLDAQQRIRAINAKESSEAQKWDEISVVLEEMYNSLSEPAKESLRERIADALEEYETKLAVERSKTVIHKISIEDEIEYFSRAEVNGHLLNQFSLDEFEGNLRVATTTSIWTGRGSTMYNNVYILDEGMDIIGSVEDIAPDERIYSTRFIGGRLYMVTFKNIDPFFVIALDPQNPRILGELKIPGFSNYLHPYDENTIIGIGKETQGNEWGGVSTGGLKLALFDVRDVEHPREIDTYVIGEAGTDSEALYEHKAFLFNREKNLLVLPVREQDSRVYDARLGYYRWEVTQGAYAFAVDATSGFTLQGKISHGRDEYDQYYYGSPLAVRRSLFMDDYLYTISAKKIKVNDLNDLSEVKELVLPYEAAGYPTPYSGGIMVEDAVRAVE